MASTARGPVPLELGIAPDELFLLNSTSGTTGLPKCVMHTPNRYCYFHKRAAISGQFKAGLTGHRTARDLGVSHVIGKPFTREQLLRVVHDVIGETKD